MDQNVKEIYKELREIGHNRANGCLQCARKIAFWESLGDSVRLVAEPEYENYFDVYGEPDTDKERREIESIINAHGLYWVRGEFIDPITETWVQGGSCGMIIPDKYDAENPRDMGGPFNVMWDTLCERERHMESIVGILTE